MVQLHFELSTIFSKLNNNSQINLQQKQVRQSIFICGVSSYFPPLDARNRNKTANSDSSPSRKAQQSPEQKKELNTNNSAIIKSIFQNTLKNFGRKQEEKELPKVEGFLKKRSPSFFKVWQVRYVILRNKKFFYYRNEVRDEKPAGCLDFDLFSAKIEILTQEPKTFM